MEKRKREASAVLLLAFLLAPLTAAAGAPDSVLEWAASRCRVRLEAERQEGILYLRAGCPLSPEEATNALSDTLPALRARGDSPSAYRLLFIGRLVDYPWMSEGLARWAANSRTWDARRGRPRSEKNINRFVANALGEAGLLAPFVDALGREHLRVAGVSLEKVLIDHVQRLPFGAKLRGEGVAVAGRLPFDALVHLRLTLEEEAGAAAGH